MKAEEFVQPYPDRMSPEEIHRGAHSAHIGEAQDYSYKWGRLLRAMLSQGEDTSAQEELNVRAYGDWLDDFDVLQGNHLASVPVELRARALNETNFHTMNSCLRGMWLPLATRTWDSPAERAKTLNGAELGFAFVGLSLYAQREKFIREAGGTHALFDDPETKQIHEALTGMVQEYDAALVLLSFIRKHPT